MAAVSSTAQPQISSIANNSSKNMSSVKVLAESPGLDSIPSTYAYSSKSNYNHHQHDPMNIASDVPVIDFALLNSNNPDHRRQVIQDLGRACQDWGFFMLVNHGIPESLTKGIIEVCDEFFNLGEEEKMGYETKHVLDPIRCGTSFNASKEDTFFWRDFLKVLVHPHFHSPSHPKALSEILGEYTKGIREIGRKLLGGISEGLGLEEGCLAKLMDMDSSLQIFIANYYPPCPQPELAMGMPPHSDHGLLTLLLQNGVGGLQIQHEGKWIDVSALPNSFLVNTGDHLEIVSNGKYKSVLHRAVVNNKVKRISIAVTNGPSLDTNVAPALPLLDNQIPALYSPMKYREYLELQQGNQLDGKSCLDRVKLQPSSSSSLSTTP